MKINSTNYQNILKQYNEAKTERPKENQRVSKVENADSNKEALQEKVADITISKD